MRVLPWQQARFPRQSSVVKRGIPRSMSMRLQERELAAEGSLTCSR